MKTHTIAAIDIGSNSLKLAVVKAAADNSLSVVWQERERLRLGQETLKNHRLSSNAIELSAAAIERFRLVAANHEADTILAVATASVREADNSDEFINQINARTGIAVTVLSAVEEARLIGIAAAEDCRVGDGTLLNIDIGGGSTELSLMANGEPRKLFSMPVGAVGLTEKFIHTNPPYKNELDNLRAAVNDALVVPICELQSERWQMTSGTSGTVFNLAALLNFRNKKPQIELKNLAALNKMLARISLEERARLPVISPQRAEVIVAGGQILESTMRALEIEILTPCAYALREGVVIDYLRKTTDA